MFKRLLQSFLVPVRQVWAEKTDKKIRAWSGGLQQWFHHFSRKRQIIILVLFCVLTCASYSLILWQAFGGKTGPSPMIRSIRVPRHALETGEPNRSHVATHRATQAAILQFRHYTDSLQQSANGKAAFDSLRNQWPGIMDSLDQMEKLYQLK